GLQAVRACEWKGQRGSLEAPQSTFALLEVLWAALPDPKPSWLILEGIQALLPGGKISDNAEVGRFCLAVRDWCEQHDCAALGPPPSPNTRLKDGGSRPRDKPLGAVAWAEAAHTLWVLDQPEAGSSLRELTCLTRHAPSYTLWYDFDSK